MSNELNFDPTRRDVQTDPYPFYRRLRDEAPVYYIAKLNAYALSRYEDCKNAFLHRAMLCYVSHAHMHIDFYI